MTKSGRKHRRARCTPSHICTAEHRHEACTPSKRQLHITLTDSVQYATWNQSVG